MFFASKKVFASACRNYRYIWENAGTVEFERMNGSNYVRLSGTVNGFNYQVHVNDNKIASRVSVFNRIGRDSDAYLLRVFAVACACADMGLYFKKYAYIANNIVLNY